MEGCKFPEFRITQSVSLSLTTSLKESLQGGPMNIDSTEVISVLSSGNPLYNAIIDECRLKLRM